MVIKGKERLRTCPKLEEAWETRQLNTMWAPGLEKDIRGTIGKRRIKSVDWLTGLCGCEFLGYDHLMGSCKMLPLREAE